jgi:NTE family protein
MFGAWEVGVWMVLREHIHFDMIVGASAGAWIGWMIACGASPDDVKREWTDPGMAKVMQPGLHRWGWLRPEALYEKARKLHAAGPARMPFGLTAVEMPQMRVRLFREGEITWKHLAATAAIPLSFPPVQLGGKWYVDGGAKGSLPLWAAEEMGATHAIGVNCLTLFPFRLMRAVVRPRQPSSKLDVRLIEPARPLGSLKDGVVWKASNVERWIEQGVKDANRALSSVRM